MENLKIEKHKKNPKASEDNSPLDTNMKFIPKNNSQ